MALPSYEEVHAWVHGRGGEPPPAPRKRPTRKGLGRYLRDCYKNEFDLDAPRWMAIHMSCVSAYATMLREFDVRLPSDTFAMDKLFVAAELWRMERREYEEGLSPQMKAKKWAQTR